MDEEKERLEKERQQREEVEREAAAFAAMQLDEEDTARIL